MQIRENRAPLRVILPRTSWSIGSDHGRIARHNASAFCLLQRVDFGLRQQLVPAALADVDDLRLGPDQIEDWLRDERVM